MIATRVMQTALASGSTTGIVLAAGNNLTGQLGTGETVDSNSFVETRPQAGPVTAVAAGLSHNLALTDRGELYAWGSTDYGKLGNGTIEPEPSTLMRPVGRTALSCHWHGSRPRSQRRAVGERLRVGVGTQPSRAAWNRECGRLALAERSGRSDGDHCDCCRRRSHACAALQRPNPRMGRQRKWGTRRRHDHRSTNANPGEQSRERIGDRGRQRSQPGTLGGWNGVGVGCEQARAVGRRHYKEAARSRTCRVERDCNRRRV
jgi:hypothetical protein